MKLQKKMLVATIALALAGVTGSVFAGTVSSTFNTYATEAVSGLTAVSSPVMAYQPGKLIAAGTSFTIYIQLNGGAQWLPAATAAATTAAAASTLTFGTAGYTTSSISTSGTVLALNFNAGSVAIPTSAVLNMPTLASSINLSGATGLASSGGIVTATFALANGTAGSNPTFPTSPLDSASGTVANSLQAITATVASSATFSPAETAQIDVAASGGPLSNTLGGLAAAGIVDFGSVSFASTPGTQLNGSGADFGFTDLTGGASFTVSGSFLPVANYTFAIETDAACTTAAVGTLVVNTAGTILTGTISILAAGPYYICGTVVSSNTAAIPATTPSIVSVKQLIGTTVAATDPGGSLYALTANGSSVTLAYYVPSNAAPGYATYVRIWNNSSLSVAVKGTMTSQAGVQLGTTQTVAIIPAGGAAILNGTTIETALGVTLAASARPTLTLSGTVPGGSLVVQAYQGNPNGTVTNFTATKQ